MCFRQRFAPHGFTGQLANQPTLLPRRLQLLTRQQNIWLGKGASRRNGRTSVSSRALTCAVRLDHLAQMAFVMLICLGDTLENAGNLKEAIETYHSMLPYISNANSTVGTTPEHRLWTERVLTRYCMLSGRHITAASRNPRMLLKSPSLTEPSSLLSSFRAWAEFWDDRHARTAGAQTPAKVESNIYRTGIWKAYYDALSILVQHHILNPLFKSMSQQTTELKSVEATYESILLQQMRFPKANQANPEIESWVDQVMANWLALCNPTVREEELGKGGRATLSRSVLEVC